MMNINAYTTQLVAIINLTDLRPVDPMIDDPAYVINVLAKHVATGRIEVIVIAKDDAGLLQFQQDFPTAGILVGDGTPDNHDEWQMLAFPKEVHDSTSPLEIFNRGREREKSHSTT